MTALYNITQNSLIEGNAVHSAVCPGIGKLSAARR